MSTPYGKPINPPHLTAEDRRAKNEAAQLAALVIEEHGTPIQQLVHNIPAKPDYAAVFEPRQGSKGADKPAEPGMRHTRFGEILKASPEIDYSGFADAHTPHIIPKGYTIAYKTYQRWEQDLVAQGGVARFLNATEDQINGYDPLPDGTSRTYGRGVMPYNMNMAVWKANALIPARLATLAHRFGLPNGEAWLLEMIYTGSTNTQIAAVLGMRTSVLIDYMVENVDPVKLKAIKQSKTAQLLDIAEDTAISVLSLPEDATPAEVEAAATRAATLSSVTGIAKFVAAARLPEFSSVKTNVLGQTAQINISFNPED